MHDRDSKSLADLYDVVLMENILLQESTPEAQALITSEAVKRLKKVVMDMHDRGVPNEENFIGFNKPDWNYISGNPWAGMQGLIQSNDFNIAPNTLPVHVIKKLVDILAKYKKTQLKSLNYNYDGEKKVLQHEILDITKQGHGKEDNDKVIFNHEDEKYGKIAVTFPEDVSKIKLNRVVNAYCKEIGMQEVENQWGKYEYADKWKIFQRHPTKIGTYYIKPDLAKQIVEGLFPKAEIKELGASVVSTQAQQETSVEQDKPKIEVLETIDTKWGKKVIITLGPPNTSVSKGVYWAIKNAGLTPSLLSFDMNSKKIFMDAKKESYERLKPFMQDRLDTSALDTYFSKSPDEIEIKKFDEKLEGGYPLRVEYIMRHGLRIAPDYTKRVPEDYKKTFRECIRYIFPNSKWLEKIYMFEIEGDYEQYVMLGRILKDKGFNVDKLREQFERMKSDGLVKPYREINLKKPNDVASATDLEFPDSGFKLFGLQKEGVAFLYRNKYAILGSETGGGKTVQMIYAAELVHKEENKPIMIITLKRVQNQFVEEIVAVMGEKERKDISIDPMVTKKWNVLYYENFSAGANLENVIKHVSSKEYSVLILDELHKVKHATSKRSSNIEKIADKAKCKWGATATISANKPTDVRNQLRILGHPMGKLDEGKFKAEFAGMTPQGYGGAYVEGDFENRVKAAEHLNKWLHLTGVYIRHSKDDMRAEKGEVMPDLNIEKDSRNSIKDEKQFKEDIKKKVSLYKDPNLAISQMLAFRDMVAKYKTTETVNMALQIVTENQDVEENNYSASKVLIFTNFIEAGKELLEKSEKALKSVNPKWKVLSFLSFTPKKELEQVKQKMEDPNAKILVMSMKMGGTGISFPNTFKTMIVNDYDWTPESVEQSEGRIYRINTNQNVRIIYNVNEGGDADLYDNVQKKKELAKIIQTYRKIYQNEMVGDDQSEALKKIIDAQKQLAAIEQSDLKIIQDELGLDLQESFSDYMKGKY